MASYDMEASPAPEARKDESKKVLFRFCRECSNMLYPLEDDMNHKLMFACKACPYSEEAVASCVYRNSLKEEVAETAGNVQDVAQDPTVGDSERSDYVYDSMMDEDDDGDDEDAIPQMCTLCGNEITCPFCGDPTQYGIALETHDPDVDDPQKAEQQVELEQRERALSGAGFPRS